MDDVAGRPIHDEPPKGEPVLRVTLDLYDDGRVISRTDFESIPDELVDEMGVRARADVAALPLLVRGISASFARWVAHGDKWSVGV